LTSHEGQHQHCDCKWTVVKVQIVVVLGTEAAATTTSIIVTNPMGLSFANVKWVSKWGVDAIQVPSVAAVCIKPSPAS